jgi:hypothetical protein
MKSLKTLLLIVFSMSQVCMGQPTITFDGVIKGQLGSDYAQKAQAIQDYDYSNAMSRGSVNLWLSLDKGIRNINKDSSIDASEKLEEVKEKVDDTYKALERYKSIDSQETIQEDKVALLE